MIPMRLVNSIVLVGLCGMLARCDDSSEMVVAPAPAAIETQLEQAELLLSHGQSAEAARVVTHLLESTPADWRVHDVTARIRLFDAMQARKDGLMDRAGEALASSVDAYRAATAAAPSLAGLHQSAASAAFMAGEHGQATDWFRRAMELDPDDPRPPLFLAQLVFESDPAEAGRLLGRAIALDPTIAEAHASIALLEASNGQEEAALAAMATALSCGEPSPALRVVQAKMYRTLGNPARGVEVLLALPIAARGDEATAGELAECWELLGRPDRSADAWAICFSANAHRTDAWVFALRAARCHLAAGDRSAAAGCIAQAEMLSAPRDRVDALRKQASDQRD